MTPQAFGPALALSFNALVWGLAWWPFRLLEAHGLHPLWATVLIYAIAVVVIVALRPRAVRQLLSTPSLWVLVLAAGTTNAAFNWAVVIGDVVRVILLFYLLPLWTVLLARLILHEPLSRSAALRVLLALAGAAVVLWPPQPEGAWTVAALPLPRSLADWLGVLGGLSFALNNVMLKREAERPEEGRALAMFFGGALVAALLATTLASAGRLPWPPAPSQAWVPGTALLAAMFLASNLSLQYGASRLPANVTSVVMLTEVVFATGSAVLWGAGVLSGQALAGGSMIVLAALLAAVAPR